ncbi:hypothetical protein K469DRAFT_745686 [Zopfia rhizophila CBS 207.26]|uniref:Uncharacterized protein n=1 Tax=Zopfia rhizophila CBS 207.26 TaxID=1314779 RepID=A0A6A6ELK2_9PEZI|nr:hypothetical protein K469DRAFT_745686 [Zopfia rhizophila CBS 207.26]
MYVVGTLLNGVEDILNPAFRTIQFGDSPSQLTVVTLLRNAWTAAIPEDIEKTDASTALSKFTRENGNPGKDYGSPAKHPQNANKDEVDTRWRSQILYTYNHLFYDIGNMLPEVNCSLGHHHPPNHTSFTVSYPSSSSHHPIHEWDKNIVFLPAFLDKDLELRVSRIKTKDGEVEVQEMGVFNENHMTEAWFVAKGVKIRIEIVVKGDGEEKSEEREGVAAVFVVGILCTEEHEQNNKIDGKRDDE